MGRKTPIPKFHWENVLIILTEVSHLHAEEWQEGKTVPQKHGLFKADETGTGS